MKGVITSSPILVSLDFRKHFIIYTFASEYTIALVLIRKNHNGNELPISFMRKELHDYELKYSSLEKQAYALVKEVGHFQTYLLNTPFTSLVPYPLVKMMLSQPLREGRWENWLAKLQEFDIEVRPMKVVKWQGICKLMSGIDVVNL